MKNNDFNNSKEIGRVAGRMFASACPAHWICRSQEDQEDYGIDYEVEVADAKDAATGLIFKAQVKGESDARYLASGDLTYSSLKVERLRYYLDRLRTPVILVVVDVMTKVVRWSPIHGSLAVQTALTDASQKGQATVTIHLPDANQLPGTEQQLLAAVSDGYDWVTLLAVSQLRPERLASLLAGPLADSSVRNGLHDILGKARLFEVDDLISRKDFDGALRAAQSLSNSRAESFQDRVLALMRCEKIGLLQTHGRIGELDLMGGLSVAVYAAVRKEKAGAMFRLFSILLMRVTRIAIDVDQLRGCLTAIRMAEEAGDNFGSTVFITISSRHMLTSMMLQLQKLQFGIGRLMQFNGQTLWAIALERLLGELGRLLALLRIFEVQQIAEALESWGEEAGLSLFRFYQHIGMDGQAVNIAILLPNLWHGAEDEVLRSKLNFSRELIDGVKSQPDKARGEKAIRAIEVQVLAPAPVEPPDLSDDFFYDHARSLGVPIDDTDNRIAQIVRIGVRDRNPERVLRNCQHLRVAIESHGMVGEMMGLPTAGFKRLSCAKHGHAFTGMQLDSLYSGFVNAHCQNCTDLTPHPTDWKWTHKWQREAEAGQTDGAT